MKTFKAPINRWGSIMGLQEEGLQVFQHDGKSYRMPKWMMEYLIQPLFVYRSMYRGLRPKDR